MLRLGEKIFCVCLIICEIYVVFGHKHATHHHYDDPTLSVPLPGYPYGYSTSQIYDQQTISLRGLSCNNGKGKTIRIGTTDQRNANIEVCYNNKEHITYWTIHFMKKYPKSTSEFTFVKDHFSDFSPNEFYENSGWDKGQLTPAEDFDTAIERKMTYYYVNAAPQEPNFGKQKWSILEQSLRNKVDFLTTKILTGTLEKSDESIGEIPVPKYFYKVVVSDNVGRESPKAVAFIGFNRKAEENKGDNDGGKDEGEEENESNEDEEDDKDQDEDNENEDEKNDDEEEEENKNNKNEEKDEDQNEDNENEDEKIDNDQETEEEEEENENNKDEEENEDNENEDEKSDEEEDTDQNEDNKNEDEKNDEEEETEEKDQNKDNDNEGGENDEEEKEAEKNEDNQNEEDKKDENEEAGEKEEDQNESIDENDDKNNETNKGDKEQETENNQSGDDQSETESEDNENHEKENENGEQNNNEDKKDDHQEEDKNEDNKEQNNKKGKKDTNKKRKNGQDRKVFKKIAYKSTFSNKKLSDPKLKVNENDDKIENAEEQQKEDGDKENDKEQNEINDDNDHDNDNENPENNDKPEDQELNEFLTLCEDQCSQLNLFREEQLSEIKNSIICCEFDQFLEIAHSREIYLPITNKNYDLLSFPDK